MVVWIIGMSAAGKTSLAECIVSKLRDQGRKVVLLDGDTIRELFKNDIGYTLQDREQNAERLSCLTKFLAEQEVDVVAAVLSNFPYWREWNRENVPGYYEVYLQASIETLLRRETKNLYRDALVGKIKNVVGVDIEFIEPRNPDLLVNNDEDRASFNDLAEKIIRLASSRNTRKQPKCGY